LKDDPTEYTGRNAYHPVGVISNSLRHIVCDNVDPAFRKLWLDTPTIEVVEVHMCKMKPWDDCRSSYIFFSLEIALFSCVYYRVPRNWCSSHAPSGSHFLCEGQALACRVPLGSRGVLFESRRREYFHIFLCKMVQVNPQSSILTTTP
jgi:hypothetical protein